MRILLHECVQRKLKHVLSDHDVRTVSEMNWQGIKNGKLLQLAATALDAFLTVDRNLQYQQNLQAVPLPVIVVHSKSIRWEDLRVHSDSIRMLVAQSLIPKLYEIE